VRFEQLLHSIDKLIFTMGPQNILDLMYYLMRIRPDEDRASIGNPP